MNEPICHESLPTLRPKTAPLHQGHERLHKLNGVIRATVLLCQPLHIGSGLMEPPALLGLESEHLLVKSFFHAEHQRIIPGTSLKGAFRSLVEMFTHSCVPGEKGACSYRRQHTANLCPACRLFGALGFQGFVSFDDVLLPDNLRRGVHLIPPQYSEQGQNNERRYYPYHLACTDNANWPVEVLEPHQIVTIQARFTGIDQAHLGILLIAMGQGQWHLCPKWGGGKSAGLGSVEITTLKGEVYDPKDAASSFDITLHSLDISACLETAWSLIEPEHLSILAEDMTCQCNEENQ